MKDEGLMTIVVPIREERTFKENANEIGGLSTASVRFLKL